MWVGLQPHDAAALTHTVQPEWQETQDVDLSAFRYMVEVEEPTLLVPTVLEVPVVGRDLQNKTVIVADGAGGYQTAFFKTTTKYPEVPMTVAVDGGNAISALTDNRFDTVEDFPFTEEGINRVKLTFHANKNISITTSELHIVLAPNVALPETVAIQSGYGPETKVLVSKTALQTTVVRFPEVTASTFTVEFEVAQPLRLAELHFVQESAVLENETVRFLALPDMQYTIYIDPDRSFGSVATGGVSLTDNEGVVNAEGMLAKNMQYQPSDADEDGIPDTSDNCVSIPNPDQTDVDRNGRGDACDDFDRDGISTLKDNCPEKPNRDQRDTDHDGVGDECDVEESRLTEKNPWIPWMGMGIAVLVLLGLLVVSVQAKPAVPVKTEGVAQRKEDEPGESNNEEEAYPQG